ncbi:MAG TPA: hypothetical protein VK961_00010 [Chthoniobacter sp.]|nr:hypothetical protein [Chthoniobacter sp.]
MDTLITLLIVGGIGGLIGTLIGRGRGRGGEGALLGFCFGPIGWIVVLLLPAVSVHTAAGEPRPPRTGAAYGRVKQAKDEAWQKAQRDE